MSNILPLRLRAADLPSAAEQPLAVDARRLASLLSVGVRTVRTWDAAGKLPAPIRVGGSVRWGVDEIRAWLDAGAPDRETWARIRAARQ